MVAGTIGGLMAAVPSTVHALATRRSPIEATMAAGTLVLPGESRPAVLMAAALPVHAALSLGWAAVLAATLPRRRAGVAGGAAGGALGAGGAAAGLIIAAIDLGLVGRRFPRIRSLPLLPQVADHVVYGLAVGWVLARRQERHRRRTPTAANW
jgi:hypothetical protein